MSNRGKYVVLEGIDGAGKTGLAEDLVPRLLHRGYSVSRYREPTDGFLRAQAARRLKEDPLGAALCFTVDRAILLPEVDRSLSRGEIVVQDRSFYSNLAYQAPLLDIDTWKELERIERTLAIEPDIVLYLDVPVEIARGRIALRGRTDGFEGGSYLVKVRAKYEELATSPSWVRIDASAEPAVTAERGMAALLGLGL